ncbi:hypothetical protein DMENIID0001_068320 [Sergentomyia squamirostris]
MFDIKITQFINPHLFYYQHEEDEDLPRSYDVDLKRLLPDKQYFLQTTDINYEPQINEIVGHYNIVDDKWMRCQVDYITYSLGNREKIFILFALDYGYSLESIGKWLLPLPDLMKEKSKTIFLGGINNIVPCQYAINHITYRNEYKMAYNWNSGSILRMHDMITTCHTLKFCPEFRLTDGHLFGKLIMKTITLDEKDVADILVEQQLAIRSTNFMKHLATIHTKNIPRWQNNDRTAVNFGLSTVSQFLNNSVKVRSGRNRVGELSDPSFAQTRSESFAQTMQSQMLGRQMSLYMLDSKTKVATWQERNQCYFAKAGDSEVHQRASEMINQLEELTVEDISAQDLMENVNHTEHFPIMKNKRDVGRIDEVEQPEKMKVQSFLESLKRLENSETESKQSSRQVTNVRPAGYIFTPE